MPFGPEPQVHAVGLAAVGVGRDQPDHLGDDPAEEVAVLHAELSAWCSMDNAQACAAVNIGPWPKKWDEPALIDAAKVSCQNGQFKTESNTCQALQMM